MLIKFLDLLLQICTSVLVSAFLLRFYLHYLRINFSPNSGNPFSTFLLPLTNWLYLPLRKLMPFNGRIDYCSLLSSYSIVVLKSYILTAISSASLNNLFIMLYAVFDWLDLVLSGFIGVILVYTLLSWTGAYSPTQQLFAQMVDPLLKPIRKITPLIANIDFSPLILLLLIQMVTVFLGQVQRQL